MEKILTSLSICCPLCKGQLSQNDDTLTCNRCEKKYPVVSGIPDLRVFGDPYLGFDDDYKRTRLVMENVHRFDFPGLLEFYWSNSPETPNHLRKKFIRSVLAAEAKGKAVLKALDSCNGKKGRDAQDVLEIGCGTGGFLVPAARRYSNVVGTDIALRWLIVAKKRFEEAGIEIPLICCCAEHLPFPDELFDLVVANATLEHTRYQKKVISESNRVLRSPGKFFLSTPNRFSLTVEPHVYIWGVGFLPRTWMHKYVKFRKGVDYKKIKLLSFFELKKVLGKHFPDVRFSLPDIDEVSLANFSNWKQFQVKIYRWIRNVPLFKAFLLLFGPIYHIFCQKMSRDRQKPVKEDKIVYFDSIAHKYFQLYNQNSPGGYAFSVRKKRVLELIEQSKGKVLDIGCGPGIMVKELTDLGYEFYGIDASPNVIDECKKRFGTMDNVNFSIGDATKLELADNFFDLVICMGVIDRIDKYELAIKEMLRVIKKDGTLIITFPNLYSPFAVWRAYVFYPTVNLLKSIYYFILRRPQPLALLSLFVKLHSKRGAVELAKKYDGKTIDTVYFNFNLFLSPLDEIFPRLTVWATRRLEQCRFQRLRWLGSGFILTVKKI
ncbi:MAG: methyltransferase domain-containing protein [Planctomycetes bacterium]|nr:methyltransferase domain-containing protein [Planctomycetota bacterium]